jgi:hypothetical protein
MPVLQQIFLLLLSQDNGGPNGRLRKYSKSKCLLKGIKKERVDNIGTLFTTLKGHSELGSGLVVEQLSTMCDILDSITQKQKSKKAKKIKYEMEHNIY